MGLPKDANASVEAATINGGVRVNDTLSLVDAKKERQHLSAKLGAGTGPRIDLQTTNVASSWAGESLRDDAGNAEFGMLCILHWQTKIKPPAITGCAVARPF